MEDSPIKSSKEIPLITIQISSDDDEKIALIEKNSSSIESTNRGGTRILPAWGQPSTHSKRPLIGDVEDVGNSIGATRKKIDEPESYLNLFRRKRGLFVTDITSSEWCEMQKEFDLLYDESGNTESMNECWENETKFIPSYGQNSRFMTKKAGRERHVELEKEVVKKIKVGDPSIEEDLWATKLINFIICANQLSKEGLTRELPLVGFVEGVWMVGTIDEIQMPLTETPQKPLLVEMKTRRRRKLPFEPKQRNGRLQLMCYKYLWDSVVTDDFPTSDFFNYFELDRQFILSEEIQERAATLGFPTKTLEDLLTFYRNTCCSLPPAHDELLLRLRATNRIVVRDLEAGLFQNILRYEFQEDHSLLGEDLFTYNSDWLKSQIQFHLKFWLGEREAIPVPPEERWKCQYQFCQFASICPSNNTTTDSTPPS